MNILNLAKRISSVVKKGETLESVYREIMSNPATKDFIKILPKKVILSLVFLVHSIINKQDYNSILPKLENLFIFSIIDFGTIKNTVECNDCGYDGYVECPRCGGDGDVRCSYCDGDGIIGNGDFEEPCYDCHGGGEVQCDRCDGTGKVFCNKCDGEGEYETDDYLPYNIEIFVSLDQELLETIEMKISRNETEDYFEFDNRETFLLYITQEYIYESDNLSELEDTYFPLSIITDVKENNLILANNLISSNDLSDIERLLI
jgi:hypothetical protein